MSDRTLPGAEAPEGKAVERTRPRRFRWWDVQYAIWVYGCYFDSCRMTVLENGYARQCRPQQIPGLLLFEWLDAQDPPGG